MYQRMNDLQAKRKWPRKKYSHLLLTKIPECSSQKYENTWIQIQKKTLTLVTYENTRNRICNLYTIIAECPSHHFCWRYIFVIFFLIYAFHILFYLWNFLDIKYINTKTKERGILQASARNGDIVSREIFDKDQKTLHWVPAFVCDK